MSRSAGGGGIGDIVALIGAPAKRLRGTCVRMTGPAEWVVSVDAAGNFYKVKVAMRGGHNYAWSWDLLLDGKHIKGGQGRTLRAVRAAALVVIEELL